MATGELYSYEAVPPFGRDAAQFSHERRRRPFRQKAKGCQRVLAQLVEQEPVH
ncbi:hypothetical protein L7F22_008692, partial [Adiantum nelumboides]|nr:hypothetical protein [Adiantum nelumboides]